MHTPGTIANAVVRGVPTLVMATTDPTRAAWATPYPIETFTTHPDEVVTDVVPVAVLAVTDEDMLNLTAAANGLSPNVKPFLAKVTAARAAATRPPEPTTRGACVVDDAGREWVRVSAPAVRNGWAQQETRRWSVPYSEIRAVKITRP